MRGTSFIQTKLPSFLKKYTFIFSIIIMKWLKEDSR